MDKVVGVLGGGQLGRMLVEAANPLNIRTLILDKSGSPAKQISADPKHVDGSFKAAADVRKLAAECDVLTVEIEHVDAAVLEELAADGTGRGGRRPDVQPSGSTIRLIQNKFQQKRRLQGQGISVADFAEVYPATKAELDAVASRLGGYPVMLKAQTDAYDGRGNFAVNTAEDVPKALMELEGRRLYAEAWAPFRLELAVMVVKIDQKAATPDDAERWRQSTLSFPVVETVHENSICKLTYSPPRDVPSSVREAARTLARQAVAAFEGRGVFGVEMFLLEDDSLLINEIAPRPHNSGHYTLHATPMSQFEAHLRAILNLPIEPSDLEPFQPSIMLNILGGSTPDAHLELARAALRGGKLYLYGKGKGTLGRKMGHVVITAPTMEEAEERVGPLIRLADRIRGEPVVKQAQPRGSVSASKRAIVEIVMGSDSDLPVMMPGLKILEEFRVPAEVRISSAHRTPERMAQLASTAESRGVKVIIGAAGGAAHLPGMNAAHTILPVIGVPVRPRGGDGMDSLLSIVQMPRGCPVATVAIDNSTNAALLAIRILALEDPDLRRRLAEYHDKQRTDVEGKAERLEALGWKVYSKEMERR